MIVIVSERGLELAELATILLVDFRVEGDEHARLNLLAQAFADLNGLAPHSLRQLLIQVKLRYLSISFHFSLSNT